MPFNLANAPPSHLRSRCSVGPPWPTLIANPTPPGLPRRPRGADTRVPRASGACPCIMRHGQPSVAHGTRPRRSAYTLIEIIVAMTVMSVMLVAALNTVAAARVGQYKAEERNRSVLLAQRLMAEILQQAYADPTVGLASFGLDTGETTGNRSLFDDVDDYNGWQASPPQNKDGSAIAWAADYGESVSVAWVSPNNLSQTAGSETGVKRIVVTIKHLGRDVLTLTAYRTSAWVDPTTVP